MSLALITVSMTAPATVIALLVKGLAEFLYLGHVPLIHFLLFDPVAMDEVALFLSMAMFHLFERLIFLGVVFAHASPFFRLSFQRAPLVWKREGSVKPLLTHQVGRTTDAIASNKVSKFHYPFGVRSIRSRVSKCSARRRSKRACI